MGAVMVFQFSFLPSLATLDWVQYTYYLEF